MHLLLGPLRTMALSALRCACCMAACSRDSITSTNAAQIEASPQVNRTQRPHCRNPCKQRLLADQALSRACRTNCRLAGSALNIDLKRAAKRNGVTRSMPLPRPGW